MRISLVASFFFHTDCCLFGRPCSAQRDCHCRSQQGAHGTLQGTFDSSIGSVHQHHPRSLPHHDEYLRTHECPQVGSLCRRVQPWSSVDCHLSRGAQGHSCSGELRAVGYFHTRGETPRHFQFDSSGQYLIVANQDSNTIAVFNFNLSSGEIKYTGNEYRVPSPNFVCCCPVRDNEDAVPADVPADHGCAHHGG